MRTPVFLLLFASAFYAITCKDNGTGPPPDGIDTTSQDFTITTQEFGDGYESAYANDAWVFSPSNIWVVGYFGGLGAFNVNIMIWNGSQWIPRVGSEINNSSGIKSIWALDSSQAYLADGLVIMYRNGVFQRPDFTPLPWSANQSVDHIWASSESNVWGVGANGCIMHYDGRGWSKVSFDPGYKFVAITGSRQTGVAFASAWSVDVGNALVELKNGQANVIFTENDPRTSAVEDVVLYDDSTFWFAGSALRSYRLGDSAAFLLRPVDGTYYTGVSVPRKNDVFIYAKDASSNWQSIFVHYNGERFTRFSLLNALFDANGGIHAIDGLAILTATYQNKALILTLRRKP